MFMLPSTLPYYMDIKEVIIRALILNLSTDAVKSSFKRNYLKIPRTLLRSALFGLRNINIESCYTCQLL